MKKLAFLFVMVAAVLLSGCEGLLGGDDKLTYECPFSDLKIHEVGCLGYSDGSVEFGFTATNNGADANYYFGWITAYTESGKEYTTGVNGYKGSVRMPNGQKVSVDFDGDFNRLKNIDSSITKFKRIEMEVTGPDGTRDQIVFNNVPVKWMD